MMMKVQLMMTLLMIDVDHKDAAVQGANYNSITCHKLSYKSNFCNGDDNYNNDGHDNDDNYDDDNYDDADDDDDYHRRERHSRDSLRKVPCHQFMQNVNYHFSVIVIINFIVIVIAIIIVIVMMISRGPPG